MTDPAKQPSWRTSRIRQRNRPEPKAEDLFDELTEYFDPSEVARSGEAFEFSKRAVERVLKLASISNAVWELGFEWDDLDENTVSDEGRIEYEFEVAAIERLIRALERPG
jgi:hypothetical protein